MMHHEEHYPDKYKMEEQILSEDRGFQSGFPSLISTPTADLKF
jgi:hypothetical protein